MTHEAAKNGNYIPVLTANGINISGDEDKRVRLRVRPGYPESRTNERLKDFSVPTAVTAT